MASSNYSTQVNHWDSIIPTTGEIIKWNEVLSNEMTKLDQLRKMIQNEFAAAYEGLIRNADWTYSRAGDQ